MWNEQYDISLVNAGEMKYSGEISGPAIKMEQTNLYLYSVIQKKKPHEQYEEDIKRKINGFHGVDNAADEVIIFGNPFCTMQIISKHWTDKI